MLICQACTSLWFEADTEKHAQTPGWHGMLCRCQLLMDFVFMPSVLVLDIGNVICEWNPEALVASAFSDMADHALALQATVGHSDWLELDRGTLALDQAMEQAQTRSGLDTDSIAAIYNNLPASLTILPSTVDAMAEAKAAGVPMYILSNMHSHSWDYLQANHECFSWCAGVAVSCEAKCVKPEEAIYRYLCERYALDPAECIFIDDMAVNIEAARAFSMEGTQLTDRQRGGELIRNLLTELTA